MLQASSPSQIMGQFYPYPIVECRGKCAEDILHTTRVQFTLRCFFCLHNGSESLMLYVVICVRNLSCWSFFPPLIILTAPLFSNFSSIDYW